LERAHLTTLKKVLLNLQTRKWKDMMYVRTAYVLVSVYGIFLYNLINKSLIILFS